MPPLRRQIIQLYLKETRCLFWERCTNEETKEEEAQRTLINKMNNHYSKCLEMKMIGSSNTLPHYCNYRCYITPRIKYSLQIMGRV